MSSNILASWTSETNIGVGAQSTLGGTTFLPEYYVWKINKLPEFYMILARKKLSKYPNFLWYLPEKLTKFFNFTWFCPKNARILHKNCQKNFFPNFRGARSPAPVSYVYGDKQSIPFYILSNLIDFVSCLLVYATVDEAVAYMFYRCFFVFFLFFFVFFCFFPSTKNMRQPFSGTAERIFVKLLPNDTGKNVVWNVVPPPGEWRMLMICVIYAMTLPQSFSVCTPY